MANWQSIVDEHSPMVWRVAYRLVGNDADAADCLQETFISALAVAQREPVHNWGGLLRRLATNRALDCLRARNRDNTHYHGTPDLPDTAAANPGLLQRPQTQELRAQPQGASPSCP